MGVFNIMELKLKHSKWVLRSHGLEAHIVELEDGSTIHCWVPADWKLGKSDRVCGSNDRLEPDESCSNNGTDLTDYQKKQEGSVAKELNLKPALLLLHGFGMDGTLCWEKQVPTLSKKFSLFVPDLFFFGKSRTSNKERSEVFQAECMFMLMKKLGIVERHGFVVCGHSYGGFVAYRMAHLYPHHVKRVVIMSSGILMDAQTNNLPLLEKFGATKIEDVLIPHSADDFQKGLTFAFHKLPWLPSFVFKDMFEILNGNQQERQELINGIIVGKENSSPLPKINQNVLILWGEHDQVFNIELAHSLKNFLGGDARLVQIKNVGHMPHMEKPKDVNLALLQFLTT